MEEISLISQEKMIEKNMTTLKRLQLVKVMITQLHVFKIIHISKNAISQLQ